jgi:uncharacterized protein YjeT (DUF2065 family)
MGQSLDPDKAEDLALLFRKVVDGLQDAAAPRGEIRAAAGQRRRQALMQLQHFGLFIQAAGQVVQFPAHMLVGEGEKFAHGPRAGCTHRLE